MKTDPFDSSHPRLLLRSGFPLRLALACLAALTAVAVAADIPLFVVLKGQRFKQDSAQLAVLLEPDGESDDFALSFESFANGSAIGSLVSGSVQVPAGGPSVPLLQEDPGRPEWRTETGAETLVELNAARPDGTYTVTLVTKNDGTKVIPLNLSGGVYPPVPQVTNYGSLQAINATSATTVQWSPMGGTGDDFIMCSVYDQNTDEMVFNSGMPLAPGALDGTSTQTVIPANTLQPGRFYDMEVLFVKVVGFDESYSAGVAGYSKAVELEITTNPPAGAATGSAFDVTIPRSGEMGVPRDSAITFHFTKPMLPGNKNIAWTVNGSSVPPTNFTYEWIDSNRALLCRYNATFPADTEVGWTLNLSGFKDAAGFSLSGTTSGSFHTTAEDPDSPPDVESVYVIKQRGFLQTGASPVSSGMWGCDPGVDMNAYNRVKAASVAVVANGRSVPLQPEPWDCSLGVEATYADKADLDRFFGNGDFTFALTTLADGPQAVTLSLGAADNYPAAPTVTNLAALQMIDPAAPATITWNALAGWSPVMTIGGGLVELEIESSSGQEVLWADNEQITGGGTQFTIPAGKLWPGRTYRVSLTFIKITDLEFAAYPDVFGGAGFSSVTEFSIRTSGTPAMPKVVLARVGDGMNLTISGGEPQRSYVVETSSDLQRWLPQAERWIGDTQTINQYFDPDARYLRSRYYRLRDRLPGEWVQPNVTIQGTVWANSAHTIPAIGAVVGTSLDGRTTVTDSAGRFFLETDTQSSGNATYTIKVVWNALSKDFGPWLWGDQPREQQFDM